jgi:hypothetical protein
MIPAEWAFHTYSHIPVIEMLGRNFANHWVGLDLQPAGALRNVDPNYAAELSS